MEGCLMDWKLYYADGGTVDSDRAALSEIRADGIVAIVQPDPVWMGREILNRWDFYIHDGAKWRGATFWDVIDRMLHGFEDPGYAEGTLPDRATFVALYDAAHDDPDFPKKTGYSGRESPRWGCERYILPDGTVTPTDSAVGVVDGSFVVVE
jgi:hypothetical protein